VVEAGIVKWETERVRGFQGHPEKKLAQDCEDGPAANDTQRVRGFQGHPEKDMARVCRYAASEKISRVSISRKVSLKSLDFER
jgi:GMP synthase-like glutamine amidotransferase